MVRPRQVAVVFRLLCRLLARPSVSFCSVWDLMELVFGGDLVGVVHDDDFKLDLCGLQEQAELFSKGVG
jgi:hypothetical protein